MGSGYTEEAHAFDAAYLRSLRRQVLACRWFTTNTLNRDFVGTRGFSVVFRRDAAPRVAREFPFFGPFLDRALRDDCNAFYLNPLLLARGSRVDPHIDRSLRSYDADVLPPAAVSVLYVEVPAGMQGGRLVLQRGRKLLGRIVPAEGTLVTFDGDLTHSVERMETEGARLSVVCEQYRLTPDELERIPAYVVESRARPYGRDPG
jgi:hypothetical protein